MLQRIICTAKMDKGRLQCIDCGACEIKEKMVIKLISLLLIPYLLINYGVRNRIRTAQYMEEERRQRHLKLIWYVPYIGPLLIRSYWTKPKDKELEERRGKDRKMAKDHFHESEKGFDGY